MFLALNRYDTMQSGRYHVIIMRPSLSLFCRQVLLHCYYIYSMYHRYIAFQEDAQTCFQAVSSMVFHP